jgi:hypothetical protein
MKTTIDNLTRPASGAAKQEGMRSQRRAGFNPPFVIALMLALLAPVFAPSIARAQAQVAKEVIETAVEQIFKQTGKQGLRELTEMGGREAVEDLMQQSAREGGEQLVRKVTQYGLDEGPAALRAIRTSPAKMVEALDGVSPELRSSAISAVAREPQAMLPLVRQYGAPALEVAARHPGVGEQVVEKLGQDGIQLGKQLTTDQSIVVARHADEIAALAPPQRSAVVQQILRSPGKVLDYLETHPRVLRTAAGVGIVLAIKDQIIGDGGASHILGDGRIITTPGHPGLIERILPASLAFLSTPIAIVAWIVGVALAGWLSIQLWGAWRLHRLRQAITLTATAREPRN